MDSPAYSGAYARPTLTEVPLADLSFFRGAVPAPHHHEEDVGADCVREGSQLRSLQEGNTRREECYKVCTMVKETRTKQVPVCTTRPVHYTKTVEVVRMVPKQVATTVIRCVPRDGLP